MLHVHVPEKQLFFPDTNSFYLTPKADLSMEHSLVSVRKWESRWKIPFLGKAEKTVIQMMDYLKCMTLTKNVDPYVYQAIPPEEMERIGKYIKDPMSATTFSDNGLIGAQRNRNEVVTAETIYYWMITLNIPVEFEKWHLEQLLALIKLTSYKNDPKKKKMAERDVIAKYAAINEANRKKFGIKG